MRFPHRASCCSLVVRDSPPLQWADSAMPVQNKIRCTRCKKKLPATAFSEHYRQPGRGSKPLCRSCAREKGTRLRCSKCTALKTASEFSGKQLKKRRSRKCKNCCTPALAAAVSGQTRTREVCGHCGASLLPGEDKAFCCASGKHAIDFSKYFREPCQRLLNLYQKTWTATRDKIM